MKHRLLILTIVVFAFKNGISQSENERLEIKDNKGNIILNYSYIILEKDTILNGSYIEYYSNRQIKENSIYKNGIKIDTCSFYEKNGELKLQMEYACDTFPRVVIAKTYLSSGACRYIETNLLEIESNNIIKNGVSKYYWKNMQIMDSVIYKNNKQIYRARFNKKGILQFEK